MKSHMKPKMCIFCFDHLGIFIVQWSTFPSFSVFAILHVFYFLFYFYSAMSWSAVGHSQSPPCHVSCTVQNAFSLSNSHKSWKCCTVCLQVFSPTNKNVDKVGFFYHQRHLRVKTLKYDHVLMFTHIHIVKGLTHSVAWVSRPGSRGLDSVSQWAPENTRLSSDTAPHTQLFYIQLQYYGNIQA